MQDYADPIITLKALIKSYEEAKNRNKHLNAYELAIDIVDIAQQLEDISQQDTVKYEDK